METDLNEGLGPQLNGTEDRDQLKKADVLRDYQEGRTDVRVYAGLLIQVVTLLLSTLIITTGWIAKDFAVEKHNVAVRAIARQLAQKARVPSTDRGGSEEAKPLAAPKDTEPTSDGELEMVSVKYWHLLEYSPVTSLILAVGSFFMLVVLCMLTMLVYQIQRKRYECHELADRLGLSRIQPVIDPVLTNGAFLTFILILGLAACTLLALTFFQMAVCLPTLKSTGFMAFLLSCAGLVVAKFWHLTVLVRKYRRFDLREGWAARWRRAAYIVADLKEMLMPCPRAVQNDLEVLAIACSTGGRDDDERHIRRELAGLAADLTGLDVNTSQKEALVNLFCGLKSGKLIAFKKNRTIIPERPTLRWRISAKRRVKVWEWIVKIM